MKMLAIVADFLKPCGQTKKVDGEAVQNSALMFATASSRGLPADASRKIWGDLHDLLQGLLKDGDEQLPAVAVDERPVTGTARAPT